MVVTVLEILGGLAVLALLAVVFLAVRRRILQRGGNFDCSLRLAADRKTHGRGWTLGVARFDGERLLWYRVFSVSPRPRRILIRDTIRVLERRVPEPPESLALMVGHVVLVCRAEAYEVDLAMSPDATTGFLAWLEAGPPGRRIRRT